MFTRCLQATIRSIISLSVLLAINCQAEGPVDDLFPQAPIVSPLSPCLAQDPMKGRTCQQRKAQEQDIQRQLQAMSELHKEIQRTAKLHSPPNAPRCLFLSSFDEGIALAYKNSLVDHIETRSNAVHCFPRQAHGGSFNVLLLIEVNAAGQLLSVEAAKSSGHPAIDAAALSCVRQSAPFPAFPAELGNEYDLVHLTRHMHFGTRAKHP